MPLLVMDYPGVTRVIPPPVQRPLKVVQGPAPVADREVQKALKKAGLEASNHRVRAALAKAGLL